MNAILYAALCLIWGSTWVAIKIGLDGVPPFLGAGLRFLLSTAIVGMVVAARATPLRLTRDDRICVLSAGLLLFWLDYAAVYWAEQRIASGLTAVLFSTMPLITALLSAYWTRTEQLQPRKLTGIVVGVAGTVLLFWRPDHVGLDAIAGMGAALLGAACAAINLVTVKKHGQHTNVWLLNFLGMAIGTVCLIATSAVMESRSTVTWTRSNVLALVYLAVVGSVVAFSAYYYLVKQMEATALSLTTLIIPIVALAFGRAFLHETVTGTAILAVAVILAGVALAITPAGIFSRRRRVTPPSAVLRADGRGPC